MKHVKHFYFLLAFGVLAAVGLSGFYGLSLLAARKVECQKLDEVHCQDRVECATIYQDGFKECVALSTEARTKIEAARQQCLQTGGEWKSTKFGDYCDCATVFPPLQYAPGKGCGSR